MVKQIRKRNGKYVINGKSYQQLVGSRAQVMHGTAYKTGHGKKGLTKSHLKMVRGRVVSVRASKAARKHNHLGKYISLAKKNKGKKFVTMKKGMVKGKRKTRRTKRSKKRRR